MAGAGGTFPAHTLMPRQATTPPSLLANTTAEAGAAWLAHTLTPRQSPKAPRPNSPLTNTTAGAVSVTAHAVPSGGTASDGNAFLKAKSIAANDYLDVDVPIIALGGTLQALASANTSITAHMISGGLFA